MSDDLLKEQLDYYRARAQEYDESVQQTGRFAAPEPVETDIDREWAQIVAVLRTLKPAGDALELACGTGLWTKELAQIAAKVTAVDGAPEMLDTNRAKLPDAGVEYKVVNLFEWTPETQHDLVFFAFWLSHVPSERLETFLDTVTQATKVGGRVFIVDEPAGGNMVSGENENGMYQSRTLHDGREFHIVKVYYAPSEIQAKLAQRGFDSFTSNVGDNFFYLCGTRAK